MNILVRPIVNEKVQKITEKSGNTQYAFVVNINANKIEIKKEIERKYTVNVLSCRTARVIPKKKRRFSRTGIIEGKTKATKKAYITIEKGQEIDFYANLN